MNKVFQQIIKDINTLGSFNEPRGQQVKELLMDKRRIDSRKPFIDFESRPFNYKYFAGEIAWYLLQDNDIEFISDYSKFWTNLTNPNSNEINSNYGSLLFDGQLEWCKQALIADPNSRQAIAFLNQPKFQFKDNRDFVCTMYLNFWLRDNKLHMKVQMRSNDIFYGLTYDAPFFAFIHQHMVHDINMITHTYLEIGDYYHMADNIHYYNQHSDLAKDIINERTETDLEMKIKLPLYHHYNGFFELLPRGKEFIDDVRFLNDNDGSQDDFKLLLKKYILV